jgi:hypothetical protein
MFLFKDTFQVEETPYEVLGLDPGASPADIQAALPRFMRDRKNLPRLAVAQQALRKLKAPADRAQVDIWLYSVETEAQKAPDVGRAPADELYFKEMPIEDLAEFDITGS